MVANIAGKDAPERVAATASRRGAKKGGLDFERGERRAAPVAPKAKRPPTEAEKYIASLQKINGAKYLNMALPRDHASGHLAGPLESAVCSTKGRCGHAYAHVMVEGREVCRECEGEAWEMRKAAFAREMGLGEEKEQEGSLMWQRSVAHEHLDFDDRRSH